MGVVDDVVADIASRLRWSGVGAIVPSPIASTAGVNSIPDLLFRLLVIPIR
jgi:hypothetical protein